jgi:hypothetical protein
MFSQIARVVAVVAFLGGLAQVAVGLAIATGVTGPYEVALTRYAGGGSSGELIDQGILVWLIGLVLGVLAEIGLAIRRMAAGPSEK